MHDQITTNEPGEKMEEITNTDDFINSADLRARITELEAKDCDEFEADELSALCDLADEISDIFGVGYAERNNVVIVHDAHFERYARESAYDMGDVREDGSVDSHVDWEGYADAVRVDWAEIDFDGETYLVRG